MKRLTCRERDTIAIDSGTPKSLSQAEADSLAQLEALPKSVLHWERKHVRFGGFCGIIRTKCVAIELLPKIQENTDEPTMRGLLVAMLRKTGRLGKRWLGDTELKQQDKYLLDIFIEDFCHYIEAALRGGAIARYWEKTENLRAVRGRIELSDHLRRNAFDQSQILCRFAELSIDNPYNRVLKGVLHRLLVCAHAPRTRAIVASFLHRFDAVSTQPVNARDIDALCFDRTIAHWRYVFDKARLLLKGLFPDVRLGDRGDSSGSMLLFNMEELFEALLAAGVRRACRLRVTTQGPKKNLADKGFQLRPDITLQHADDTVAIIDAKWKHLTPNKSNASVASEDAYQMNAYASRYRCQRLALVYPASKDCQAGTIEQFTLKTEQKPRLDIIAIDIEKLTFNNELPSELTALLAIAS